ncbi:MAG: RNA polymerase sigma factor [Prevotella sp.]|nr:RNA polymerase sigma factor [Prevotella sp.]
MLDIKRDILPLKNIMYRLALRITLNSQEAEDIVQDVIIKLWKQQSGGTHIDNLEAYTMRMVRNLALDRQRMKVNQTENIDGMDFSGTSSVEDAIENDERIDSIRKAMDALPEKQRVAMQLRDFEGRSYKEIADIMEITEDQVKVNIFRARQTIRQLISAS